MRLNAVIALTMIAALAVGQAGASSQEATPSPNGAAPTVISTREVTLEGRYLSMSPDGHWIATFDRDNAILCAVEAASIGRDADDAESDAVENCVSFSEHGIESIADEYARWSPDGTRLAFTENGPLHYVDADIWVFTAESGEIVNLTDDGVAGGLDIFGDEDSDPLDMDLMPAWSPDSTQIAFARSSWDGNWQGTQLMLIPADGSGEAEPLVTVDADLPMSVYFGVSFSPDGSTLYYTRANPDRDDPGNGVWKVSLDDLRTEQVAALTDPERGTPTLAAVSATGDRLLLYDPLSAGQFGTTGSAYELFDLSSGERAEFLASDPDEQYELMPVFATFSPDGEWLVFVGSGTDIDSGLFVRPASVANPGQDQLLLGGDDDEVRFYAAFWGTNGTIFAPTSPASGLIIEVSGGSEPPDVPLWTRDPAEATPAASPAAGGPVNPAVVEAGTELVINDAVVALRSAPAPDAPVVAELSGGTGLVALGPVENGGGFSWIPVREPESGTIGYVRAELVSLSQD